jgi:hypothetical protein
MTISGIATYSQVGAQFGYGLAWSLVFSYPLMATIQEISARIGRVTGLGIAGNLRRHYSAWLSGSIVLLLLIANLINLGADLGAMGAALTLMIGGPPCSMSCCSRALCGVADLHPLCPLCSIRMGMSVGSRDLRFRAMWHGVRLGNRWPPSR